jgi:hypothetical protein
MKKRRLAASHINDAAILALFLLISILLFGLPLLSRRAGAHVGFISDPSQMIWHMAWWPYAISRWINPFITRVIWAPVGYNLTWATSMPAVALFFAPITLWLGPIASYNCAALAAPALSGWAAYLLCRRLRANLWAALGGGLIYGFSPYEVGHVLGGHLSLTPIFVPPLCLLLALSFIEGDLSPGRFAVEFTLLLILQFLTSNEIFATMTIFGAAALLGAIVLFPERRRGLIGMMGPLACSYAATTTFLAPFLYYAFANGAVPREGFFSTASFSADLLSSIVPGTLMLVQPDFARAIVSRFDSNMFENGWYLSLPLLAMAFVYFWKHRGEPGARLLLLMLLVCALATLGPELHVGGRAKASLPWSWTAVLPLIRYALPIRFACYSFLLLAIIFAFAVSERFRWRRVAVAAIALALFPNPAFLIAPSAYDEPAFFADHLYRRYLTPGENILFIPYGIASSSMVWQAQSAMYFRMAGGYMGIAPEEFRRWPLLATLTNSIPVAHQAEQFRDFVSAHQVDAIIVTADASQTQHELPASIGLKPISAGGVSLFRVTDDWKTQTIAPDLQRFQRDTADLWVTEMLCAANRFVTQGGDLSVFNPAMASRLGLLPGSQWSDSLSLLLAGLRTGGSNGLWIGPGGQGTLELGLPASGAVAHAIAAHYTSGAGGLFYPYPRLYSAAAASDDDVHFLLMRLPSAALASCRPDVAANKR